MILATPFMMEDHRKGELSDPVENPGFDLEAALHHSATLSLPVPDLKIMDTWNQDSALRDIRICRRPRDSHPTHKSTREWSVLKWAPTEGASNEEDATGSLLCDGQCAQVRDKAGAVRTCRAVWLEGRNGRKKKVIERTMCWQHYCRAPNFWLRNTF